MDAPQQLHWVEGPKHKLKLRAAARDAESSWNGRQVVGPSGHATKPAGATLAAYMRCLPAESAANRHVKTIVNLKYALRVGEDPHSFHFLVRPGAPLQR